ncbi:MAG: acyltransferase family protein [Actinopolymorphaceae bacterium]
MRSRTRSDPHAPSRRSGDRPAGRHFRADVEGLRAVAVGLVLLYHAGLPFVPGGFVGVDIFFVISGFLITGLLTNELRRTGTISLATFYARRAKRLLPAAALVLAATMVMTLVLLPQISWRVIGGDIVASALYVVNWRLANRSVDYLAEDADASPVQHFWSLAVEEQFYLIWPVLLLLVVLLARRRGRAGGWPLWVGLAAVGVPSFAWSVHLTGNEPASAFFVTTTRMWELAIGGGVALAATASTRLPQGLAVALGWVGLAAIAVSALLYSTDTGWPGSAALLPTLGAAAVIATGNAAGPTGPIALLGTRLFTWVGGLSYSLYLWHWPMVVGAAAYANGLRAWQGLVVVSASFVPAWLTYRFVENPIRYTERFARAPRLVLSLGAALSLVGVVAGLVPAVLVTARTPATSEVRAEGAAALGEPPDTAPSARPAGVVPDPLNAVEDVPDAYDRGCQAVEASVEPVSCVYGDPDGNVDIVVVGDSKILQWISSLDTVGKKESWRIRTFTKSTCSFSEAVLTRNGKPYDSCTKWNAAVLTRLRQDPPDVVVTSQGRSTALDDPDDPDQGSSTEAMVRGLRSRWTTLTELGSRIVVIRDNPNPPSGDSVYACVAEHRQDPETCAFDQEAAVQRGAGEVLAEAASGMRGVHLVDMSDYFCLDGTCPAVIGNVLVYRQGTHVTKTYVDTLAPALERKLRPLVEQADR